MIRPVALTAVLTGAFCAAFALAVEVVTDVFGLWRLVLVSFLSGALGSLFAQTVVRTWRKADEHSSGETER